MASSPSSTPVLLLKTASTPSDSYHELLSSHDFAPRFVPVLLHQFVDQGLDALRSLLHGRKIGQRHDCTYGGLIFTSQRAVEAFAKLVDEQKGDPEWPHLQDMPIYTVGPATTRALSAIPQQPPLQIFGSHTGNGDALAQFILEHYNAWPRPQSDASSSSPAKRPLLFVVGEQRRDVIPRILTDKDHRLPADQRIDVTEEIVYGTGVMPSFAADFDAALEDTKDSPERWVVVFSPTGCDGMLRGLGVLDEGQGRDGKTFVATIGPTTRSHLVKSFGFEPDVCAETPSPEGVLEGIREFQSRRRQDKQES